MPLKTTEEAQMLPLEAGLSELNGNLVFREEQKATPQAFFFFGEQDVFT